MRALLIANLSYIIPALAAVGGVILTFLGTYIMNKRKQTAETNKLVAETESTVLSNLLSTKHLLDELTAPLVKKVEYLEKEVEKLRPLICNRTECINRKKYGF